MTGSNATVEFMSQEHVDRMNALLAGSEEVRAVCAGLSAPRAMAYRLTDGPAGRTVYWRVSFDQTVRFELIDGPADVAFVGDWAQMIRATRAGRGGEEVDPGVRVEGNEVVLAEIGPVLELARSVATIPVDFPEV